MEILVWYEVKDRVGYITLNRPDKRNALSPEMVSQLTVAVDKAERDTECKVVVLAANGEVFCAGADLEYIKSLQSNGYEENLADSSQLMELFSKIYRSSKVFISRIQGHALAGGCGLATVCDFAFAVPEAKFGYTEVRIGFIPAIVMIFLLRKIGEGKAKEILLSGEIFQAQRAKDLGLINGVLAENVLNEQVHAFAQKLVNETSGESLARTKTMIGRVQDLSLEEALNYAAGQNAEARAGKDCQRGISAFLNKEKISW